MLQVTDKISIPDNEIKIISVYSQGPGGQHVNKVSTAVQLKFDVKNSSLPDSIKEKIYKLNDSRITKDNLITIKSQKHRSQAKNREDACCKLVSLIRKAVKPIIKRKPTKPTLSSKLKRLESKNRKSKLKFDRKKVD